MRTSVTVCSSISEEISICIIGVTDDADIKAAINKYLFQSGYAFQGDLSVVKMDESHPGNRQPCAIVSCAVRQILGYVDL